MLHLHLYNTQAGYILLFLVNPIGIVILVNYIRSIPRELDEAAAMDGSSYVRFVLRVDLPADQAGAGQRHRSARNRDLERVRHAADLPAEKDVHAHHARPDGLLRAVRK